MAEARKSLINAPLGFGIVGCGLVSEFHARAIQACPRARLIGFHDVEFEKAESRARQFRAKAFKQLDDLLQHEAVHVINICTPNGLHESVALRAAAAGKHILVEKPPELTLARTDRMIHACKAAGVVGAVVSQLRFRPVLQVVHQAVKKGKLGDILIISTSMKWYRTPEYYQRDGWRGSRALEGGVLLQLGYHYIDQMRWLAGPVRSVMARTARLFHHQIETEDTAMAILEFQNGALGLFEVTTAAPPGQEVRVEICGRQGRVTIVGERIEQWFSNGREHPKIIRKYRRAAPTAARHEASFDWQEISWQIENLVDAVLNKRRPLVTLQDGRDTLEIIFAIHEAAGQRRAVHLSLPGAAESRQQDTK